MLFNFYYKIVLIFINRTCVINSKSTINDVQTIFKLLNDNESLSKSQTSKTSVLIVVNEIVNIILLNDGALTENVPKGLYYKYIFSIYF